MWKYSVRVNYFPKYKLNSAECPYTHSRRLKLVIVTMTLSSAALNCITQFTVSFKEDAFLTALTYVGECAVYKM